MGALSKAVAALMQIRNPKFDYPLELWGWLVQEYQAHYAAVPEAQRLEHRLPSPEQVCRDCPALRKRPA